ncbi:hypothetical protein N9U65_00560 [Planctomycetaceae bacterium]|nr:hypothetical protein [Planctomycetaceae bacterium]
MTQCGLFTTTSVQFNPTGGWFGVTLLVIAFACLVFVLAPDKSRLSRGRRLVLISLRISAFLVLLFCLMKPRLVSTRRLQQPASVLVLADSSESMTVADGPNGKTRWEHLRETLQSAMESTQREIANKSMLIHTWVFDREARETSLDAEVLDIREWQRLPSSGETAIGSAMESAIRAIGEQPLRAVVLLSDGGQHAYPPNDLPPQAESRRLGERGVPLWAITYGQSRGAVQARDASVVGLTAPDKVFLGNTVEIIGRVRLEGLSDREATVRLLVEQSDGELAEVGRRSVKPVENTTEESVCFDWKADSLGERKLVLEIDSVSGEVVLTNNTVSSFVNVVDGGLRVLYLEGSPRVEQRFLRRVLSSSPDIQIDFQWIDSVRRSRWPVSLEQELSRDYKVFLIGDLDVDAIRPQDLEKIRLLVENGSSIGFLGGFHSFEAGGWGSSPLGRLLPYARDPLSRQRFDEPIRNDLHEKGPITIMPDERFGGVSILRLGQSRQESDDVWRGLPALDGANRLPRLLPVAKTLAITATGLPLLVAREYGLGRVLVFAVDSTWRWAMQGSAGAYKRFWRQFILWLARREDFDGERLWLKLARRRISVGSPLVFDAGLTLPDGTLVQGSSISATVIDPTGNSRQVQLSKNMESFSGTVAGCTEPGDWEVVVKADRKGGEATARFVVYRQDLELANPRANTLLMQQIAAATDGGVRLPEDLPDIFKEIAQAPTVSKISQEWSVSLWDNLIIISIFAGCLCAEWFFRKRWGLV